MTVAVRLPEEIEARLDSLAEETGRSKSYYIREALLQYLEDMEDAYIAEQRLSDLALGKSYSVPLEDVMARYGIQN